MDRRCTVSYEFDADDEKQDEWDVVVRDDIGT